MTTALARCREDEQIDARMTADRCEMKFLLSAEQARTVVAEINARLRVHRHRGAGSTLVGAHHFVTTIYFDTPSRTLFQAAATSIDRHVKLRAKEYHDANPQPETATDLRRHPILWLELKHKHGTRTGKRRIGIPKRDVAAFFDEGTISLDMLRIQQRLYGRDARSMLDAVAELCARCAEPMRADCLVNYRRRAWQDLTGELRVTIDSGLAFFAPPDDLWSADRASLGRPVGAETRRVLEVKSHGDRPAWLIELLDSVHAAPLPFSKFDAASRSVHARDVDPEAA